MPHITSFETLEAEINKVTGKPTVLEALWDGDTQGWYLNLYIYTASGSFFTKTETRHYLGEVFLSDGMEYSTNGIMTIAVMASEFGKKAMEKYKLVFYFPSDKHPDDDCPKWTERYLAIRCADCNKLIIPTTSAYLPKDICFQCHLERERTEDLRSDKLCNFGESMFLCKNGAYRCLSYNIERFIEEKIPPKDSRNFITILTLHLPEVMELKERLDKVLDEQVARYKKQEMEEQKRIFYDPVIEEYNGKEYELCRRFNSDHSEISSLIHAVNNIQMVINEEAVIEILFKDGVTYRDDSVLRFVKYVCSGTADIGRITAHYKSIVSKAEILITIKKLEKMDCLLWKGDEVSITQLGKNIVY